MRAHCSRADSQYVLQSLWGLIIDSLHSYLSELLVPYKPVLTGDWERWGRALSFVPEARMKTIGDKTFRYLVVYWLEYPCYLISFIIPLFCIFLVQLSDKIVPKKNKKQNKQMFQIWFLCGFKWFLAASVLSVLVPFFQQRGQSQWRDIFVSFVSLPGRLHKYYQAEFHKT